MTARPNPPLMSPAQAARLLDHVIFARVAELVDLPRLYDLEAVLAYQIGSLGADPERGVELARAMIDRALLRLAQTPRRLHPRAPFIRDPAGAAPTGGRASPGANPAAADHAGRPRGSHRAAHVAGRHSAGPLPDPGAPAGAASRDRPGYAPSGASGASGEGGSGSGSGDGDDDDDDGDDDDGDRTGGLRGDDDHDDAACDLCGGPLAP